jgi:hypothetical protein
MKRTSQLLGAFAALLAACSTDSPVQADASHLHHGGLMASSLSPTANGQALDDLRQLTAPLHDVDAALAAHYALFKAPPLTAVDGCISDAHAGGMGFHYTRGDNLADDAVTLLDPEFLVYAPTDAPPEDGEAKTRLAALEYFIPYSTKWPGPADPTFKRAPTLHDFPTMSQLPDVAFSASRFNGWMFHIWLWEHNPSGMLTNWNTSVPLCPGSTF